MQLVPSEYLADTHHLNTKEHGAYLLLLMTYWLHGTALPDDDRRLARITKLSLRSWRSIRPVIEEFFVCDGFTWQHKRIEGDLNNARQKVSVARKAGKKSAEAKRVRKSLKTNKRGSTDVTTDVQRTYSKRYNGTSTNQNYNNNPLTPLDEVPAAPAPLGGRAASSKEAQSLGDILKGDDDDE